VELRFCESTVRRAWDHAHQDQLKGAAMSGTTPDRGRYRHISDTTIFDVQSLLKEGKFTIREIACTTGLSQSTVRRQKHRMTDK
jgi:Fic family protein